MVNVSVTSLFSYKGLFFSISCCILCLRLFKLLIVLLFNTLFNDDENVLELISLSSLFKSLWYALFLIKFLIVKDKKQVLFSFIFTLNLFKGSLTVSKVIFGLSEATTSEESLGFMFGGLSTIKSENFKSLYVKPYLYN